MELVVIESPYAADKTILKKFPWLLRPFVAMYLRWRNVRYAKELCRRAFLRGFAPFASHLIYTRRGILRDHVPAERDLGINGGFAWGEHATRRIFGMRYGLSAGMRYGLAEATRLNQTIEGWDGIFSAMKDEGLAYSDASPSKPTIE